jgi:hypothetical protein
MMRQQLVNNSNKERLNMENENEAKELVGVKMLVWDYDEMRAEERLVYGKVTGLDFPFLTSDESSRWEEFKHAKPLPKPHEIPPNGYRLCTDEEVEKWKDLKEVAHAYYSTWDECWFEMTHPSGKFTADHKFMAYAVPIGYTFPKPREVAPEGYRMVTNEERVKYEHPVDVKFYCVDSWETSARGDDWPDVQNFHNFAVPHSYTFKPTVKEMTMAEVEKMAGCKVKITK